MKLYAWRTGGLFFALFLAVGCGGTSGDLPTAPNSSSGTSTAAGEKKEGAVKTMAPADAAEKYK